MKKILIFIPVFFFLISCEETIENNCPLNGSFEFKEVVEISHTDFCCVNDYESDSIKQPLPSFESVTAVFDGMVMNIATYPLNCNTRMLTVTGSEDLEQDVFRFHSGTQTTSCYSEPQMSYITLDDGIYITGMTVRDLSEKGMTLSFDVRWKFDGTLVYDQKIHVSLALGRQ